MRSLLLLAASAAVAAFGAADAAPLTSNVLTGCVAQYDASVDYFPDKVAAAPGDAWTITYQKSYKVLSNPAANETYVLYQCGTPEPTVAGANEYIPVPIDSTSISDTTVITYHELLGKVTALDYVDAFTIGLIVSPCAQKEIADKGLKPLDAANETLKEEEIASTDLYTEFSASNMTDSVVWVSRPSSGATACG
ncbi:hypothetical protein DFJ74DRAFT_240487 [Hyaloraphidium curvatum]|nr:hypothetical protein DFJ74DRAFT_240487 [Hyaloraphidium curvatum]